MTISMLLPELWLLATICALFAASVSGGKRSVLSWLPWAALAGVVIAALSLGVRGETFYGAYRLDGPVPVLQAGHRLGLCRGDGHCGQ